MAEPSSGGGDRAALLRGARGRDLEGQGSDLAKAAAGSTSEAPFDASAQLAELLDHLLDRVHDLRRCLGPGAAELEPLEVEAEPLSAPFSGTDRGTDRVGASGRTHTGPQLYRRLM